MELLIDIALFLAVLAVPVALLDVFLTVRARRQNDRIALGLDAASEDTLADSRQSAPRVRARGATPASLEARHRPLARSSSREPDRAD